MEAPRREHLTRHIVVWIARLSQSRDTLASLEPCLDGHDRERAARFHFADDRARFVLGRGLLRKCLGFYLEQSPETIELAYTDLGRPILPHDATIQFNISHTKDLVTLAVTAHAQVGIDVELAHPHPDLIELANRIFSETDFQKFQALPSGEALPAFYRAWTRKEAYLKARGEGIAEGLPLISASLGAEKTSTITDTRDKAAAQTWRVVDLLVPNDYTACLACDDAHKRVECRYVHLDKGEIIGDSSSSLK
jgi:4'-phosphopantetheinyl transferase